MSGQTEIVIVMTRGLGIVPVPFSHRTGFIVPSASETATSPPDSTAAGRLEEHTSYGHQRPIPLQNKADTNDSAAREVPSSKCVLPVGGKARRRMSIY